MSSLRRLRAIPSPRCPLSLDSARRWAQTGVGGGRVGVGIGIGIGGRRATPVVQAEEVKACAVVVVVPVVEAAAPAPSTEGKGCHLMQVEKMAVEAEKGFRNQDTPRRAIVVYLGKGDNCLSRASQHPFDLCPTAARKFDVVAQCQLGK